MRRAVVWLLPLAVLVAVAVSLLFRYLPEEEESAVQVQGIRIEVSNGTGLARAGRAVADELQMRGFDVYNVRAESMPVARTTVIDLRSRSLANAGRVARALSVQKKWWRIPLAPRQFPECRPAIDSTRYLEVRLVLGEDFRTFFPGAVPPR